VATSAPDRDSSQLQSEFEDRTRRAWVAYRDSLKDLEGSDYEEAEGRSWERLQRRLAELEGQRAAGAAPSERTDSTG
jgi:hypothetical protein